MMLAAHQLGGCDADGTEVAMWQDEELRLRLAAGELRDCLAQLTEAAQTVIERWTRGDLAAAVRLLDAVLPAARTALAKAKGDATCRPPQARSENCRPRGEALSIVDEVIEDDTGVGWMTDLPMPALHESFMVERRS